MAQLAPWLAEPIDAGASFLKGAQAGSLIAATWARKEQLGLETARVAASLQEHALEMRAKEAQLDYSLQQKAAGVELAQAYSQISSLEGGWSNPEALKTLSRVGEKHPAIVGSPIWQHGQENIFKAMTLKNQTQQIEQQKALQESQILENKARAKALESGGPIRTTNFLLEQQRYSELVASGQGTSVEALQLKSRLEDAETYAPSPPAREYQDYKKALDAGDLGQAAFIKSDMDARRAESDRKARGDSLAVEKIILNDELRRLNSERNTILADSILSLPKNDKQQQEALGKVDARRDNVLLRYRKLLKEKGEPASELVAPPATAPRVFNRETGKLEP